MEGKRGLSETDLQSLCDKLVVGEVLSAYTIDINGKLYGMNTGKLKAAEELRSRYGQMGGVVWGSLKNIEAVGGSLVVLAATYQKFKVVGVPIMGTPFAALVTVPVDADPFQIRDRVMMLATGGYAPSDFDGLLSDAIVETLTNTLGETAARSLIFHVGTDSLTNGRLFSLNLERITGSGYRILTKLIAKSLYAKLGLGFQDEDRVFSFEDSVDRARESFVLGRR